MSRQNCVRYILPIRKRCVFPDTDSGYAAKELIRLPFWNLFHFFGGDGFPGLCYFAVTPEFAYKCKAELQKRGIFDYDYSQFEKLPVFQMKPIDAQQILELAHLIRDAHATAYGWSARSRLPDDELQQLCNNLSSNPAPDRVRQATVGIVKVLDERLQR